MKETLTYNDIIRLHIESDEKSDIATIEGDYKVNNREGRKIQKIFNVLSRDIDLAKKVYKVLLEYDNITTKTEAAAACLKLGIHEDKAIQTLESISKRNDIGVRRLNAEMVIRVWKGEFPGRTLS